MSGFTELVGLLNELVDSQSGRDVLTVPIAIETDKNQTATQAEAEASSAPPWLLRHQRKRILGLRPVGRPRRPATGRTSRAKTRSMTGAPTLTATALSASEPGRPCNPPARSRVDRPA